MNIAPVDELHPFDIDTFEKEQFANVIETSQDLKLEITAFSKLLQILKMI